ncbi:MAG: SIMPL domain-containing protein, partial [Alphaproteobacteria bacterium]
MRRTLTAAMLALTALAVLPAVAQADIDDPYIQVEGEGAVQAAPDRATVSAGVETRAPYAAEA